MDKKLISCSINVQRLNLIVSAYVGGCIDYNYCVLSMYLMSQTASKGTAAVGVILQIKLKRKVFVFDRNGLFAGHRGRSQPHANVRD